MKNNLWVLFITMFLTSCAVGPDYCRPSAPEVQAFKETKKHWKIADPQDAFDRGQWWLVFHDPQLNALENQLNSCNQNIAAAVANYQQALALVDQARASYFPTVSASATLTRQGGGGSGGSGSFQQTTDSTTSGTGTFVSSGSSGSGTGTSHSLLLNASWEPDIWGSVRRTVEANSAGAQASLALLAATRLSAQASLAQFYFELRGLDNDQRLLDDTVKDYQKALILTQNRYRSGVINRTDVVQAQSQLETAKSAAVSNGITRGQYEHAIAVLMGRPPAAFSMRYKPTVLKPPFIPIAVPSILLERRPDIAQAERLIAQANAQIGVDTAAYFPTLTLQGTASYAHSGFNNWFSVPGMAWSFGPQLAQTIFDGGLRVATIAADKAAYRSKVASYRQTVLAAFQDVEDNLISVRILKDQEREQQKAARDAKEALRLVINQYKAGTVPYSSVITAQISAFTAEKNAMDISYLRMTSAVGLIKALGGGWNKACICCG